MMDILDAASVTRHSSRTYHNCQESVLVGHRKLLILKTERCWNGRSGTLGKRFRRRSMRNTKTLRREINSTTSSDRMPLNVSP